MKASQLCYRASLLQRNQASLASGLPRFHVITIQAGQPGCFLDAEHAYNEFIDAEHAYWPVCQPGKLANLLHVISRQNCLGYRASPATGPARLLVVKA